MFLKEFKDLRHKRAKLRGLPDQLNYAIPIDDYTIALKDGAFLSAFDCAGLDLNSASVEELDAHRTQGNRALARLDDGFQYNIDLFRYPSVEYSSRTFPDPVSAALDREREIQYSAEGQHFETRCVLTITYRPPADAQTRIAGVFLFRVRRSTPTGGDNSTGSSRSSASLRMRSAPSGS
jgi:type IV secretion system protein TrbE